MVFNGFIHYKNSKIPFVINKFQMDLFSDKSALAEFMKEYSFKSQYILKGERFINGTYSTEILMLVDHSVGSQCFLSFYIIANTQEKLEYDTLNFQSTILDNVFQYKYKFIELSKSGENLSSSQKEIYKIPFNLRNCQYDMSFKIGQKINLGLLEDFSRHGELSIKTKEISISECAEIIILTERFLKFLTRYSNITFEKIYLTRKGINVANLYCPFIGKNDYDFDIAYQNFNIAFYGTKLLNNLGLELTNSIENSIPLGHIGDYKSSFLPQRFIQQIMSFEYIFEKINPKSNKCLQKKLEESFSEFLYVISINADKNNLKSLTTNMKKLRVDITHGYRYFYDFDFADKTKLYFSYLDYLIECMSLKYLGFSKDEIEMFRNKYFFW